MALNPYRRNLRTVGYCVGGDDPDCYGWKKRQCTIYVCGALKRQFARRNIEQFAVEMRRQWRLRSSSPCIGMQVPQNSRQERLGLSPFKIFSG
jgi:hypothetical protein